MQYRPGCVTASSRGRNATPRHQPIRRVHNVFQFAGFELAVGRFTRQRGPRVSRDGYPQDVLGGLAGNDQSRPVAAEPEGVKCSVSRFDRNEINRKSVRSEERPISTASSTKSASAEETSVELVAPARVPSGATERGVPSSGLSNSTSVSADSVSPTCLRRARLHVSWEGTPARAAPTRAAARVKGGSALVVLHGLLGVLGLLLDVLGGGGAFIFDGGRRCGRCVLHCLRSLLRGFLQVLRRVLGHVCHLLLQRLRFVLDRHRGLLFLFTRRDQRSHDQPGTEGDKSGCEGCLAPACVQR